MMKELLLTIPGQPIAKNRPRFARKGNFVTTYSDQETEESFWIMEAREQIRKWVKDGQLVFPGPVEIEMTCWVKRPKSHFGTGRNSRTIKPSSPEFPVSKPDCDNYLKFCLDCLNHCNVWPDDAFVVGTTSKKRYADVDQEPRTEIIISSPKKDNQ